ncbi:hypothetical protein EMCRGX_G012619 [Ephydatia muelleri]
MDAFRMSELALESTEGLLIRPTQTDHQDQSNTHSSKITKFLVGTLLFSIVITCTVLSKLSLISLVSQFNKTIDGINSVNNSEAIQLSLHDRAAGIFWQLLFIILIPQFVTFFRALLFGVCGKQSRTFPWPTLKATPTGAVAAVFEVAAMTTVVFYVLPRLPSTVAIFALGGVFSAQALLDCLYLKWSPCTAWRHGYADVDEHRPPEEKGWAKVLENKLSRLVALVLQFFSAVTLAVIAALQCEPKDRFLVGFGTALSLLVLAAVWSSKMQQESHRASKMAKRTKGSNIIRERERALPSAGFKSSFINSSLQIFLYIFVSVLLSMDHSINPWCLGNKCTLSGAFAWTEDMSSVSSVSFELFLIQILSSFFGYAFMWISCTMVLHCWGLALPLYLCTPISFAVCAIFQDNSDSSVFYFSRGYSDPVALGLAMVAGSMLWIGQILTMGAFVWKKKNLILAKDAAMFLTPRYDGIFLEQYTMLNSRGRTRTRPTGNHFESHIFLDGGANGTQLTYFALQLFSLFEETLHVDPKVFQRIDTPYECQLSWDVAEVMPIYVHLKDSYKVKNKKRWSQVMYMNYVLNFRVKNNIRNLRNGEVQGERRRRFLIYDEIKMDDDNTFILTTDADIQFTPESAIVLLDRLDSDPNVGAVCARTHPQGSGPLYWYQVFDYAIGHWFQKSAEDILGTVLCCPGCFSVFRCRALRSVLDAYFTEVTTASEFLTKDMGEDRWLCTLLVEKGWRLCYCAISENYTHCPESMDEFFKQRRRWDPFNRGQPLPPCSQALQITRGNDRISILFIFFEAIMVFSTAISPATVTFVIAAGFTSAFGIQMSTSSQCVG